MENQVLNVIDNRATCRNFSEKEIPEEILNQILDAATKAPSAGGFQIYSIVKVTSREKKQKLVEYSRNQKFIEKAPVSLIFCIDYRRIKRINEVEPAPFDETNSFVNLWMSIIDTAISAQTLCLAAESLDLKSVYIGNILNMSDKISELLKLPEYVIPSIMVTLGYPKNKTKLSQKYSKNVIVHENEYRDMPIDLLMKEYKEKYSNWKMKANEKFVDKIYETAKKYHGKDYAEICKKNILENKRISPYQYWFGCYYLEEEDFMDFKEYQLFMKKKGFNWLNND
jgi:nitroreductase